MDFVVQALFLLSRVLLIYTVLENLISKNLRTQSVHKRGDRLSEIDRD